jgi:menaquinone-dependent protoporphyrinogen oxidase
VWARTDGEEQGARESLVENERRLDMRVLVAAASKYGATAGIAEAIGSSLEEWGLDADVVPVEEVRSLSGYNALVLGSGVYAGRWLKSARLFVDRYASELATMPTWLFSSGPIGDPPKPEGEPAVKLGDTMARTGARQHRMFAGKLDRSRMTCVDRTIVAVVRSPDGDFRNWDEIADWAGDIAEALRGEDGEPASFAAESRLVHR